LAGESENKSEMKLTSWLLRAAEMRERAERAADPETRQTYLEIADAYEQLATIMRGAWRKMK
jgi:hypothetical protein